MAGGISSTIENTCNINSLGGVDITNPTNGQTLVYDASTGNWINSSGGGATGYQTIQGQGTSLPQETTLNFVSPGFTVTDDPTNFRTNVSFTGGGGSGLTWNVATSSTIMASNNGYINNSASLITYTLPTTAAVGDIIRIAGYGSGLWAIAQNAGQVINFGDLDTTTGTGGSLAATNKGDSFEMVCVVANTSFVVISAIGNITIV